jgi:hypothetical protein
MAQPTSKIDIVIVKYDPKVHDKTKSTRNDSIDKLAAKLREEGVGKPVIVTVTKEDVVKVTNAIRNGLSNNSRKLEVEVSKGDGFLKVTLKKDNLTTEGEQA